MLDLDHDEDEAEHSPAAVMFQSHDVDSINYHELYQEHDADADTHDDANANATMHDESLVPISGLRIHDAAVSGVSSSPHQALIASVGDDYRLVLYKVCKFLIFKIH